MNSHIKRSSVAPLFSPRFYLDGVWLGRRTLEVSFGAKILKTSAVSELGAPLFTRSTPQTYAENDGNIQLARRLESN